MIWFFVSLSTGGLKSMSCWLSRGSGRTCWRRLWGNPAPCYGLQLTPYYLLINQRNEFTGETMEYNTKIRCVSANSKVWPPIFFVDNRICEKSLAELKFLSLTGNVPVYLFRDGYKVFFDHLDEHQIPLLIFSAGVGDVLEEVIHQNHVFHPNVRIISNYMDFDRTVGFTLFFFYLKP